MTGCYMKCNTGLKSVKLLSIVSSAELLVTASNKKKQEHLPVQSQQLKDYKKMQNTRTKNKNKEYSHWHCLGIFTANCEINM